MSIKPKPSQEPMTMPRKEIMVIAMILSTCFLVPNFKLVRSYSS